MVDKREAGSLLWGTEGRITDKTRLGVAHDADISLRLLDKDSGRNS